MTQALQMISNWIKTAPAPGLAAKRDKYTRLLRKRSEFSLRETEELKGMIRRIDSELKERGYNG